MRNDRTPRWRRTHLRRARNGKQAPSFSSGLRQSFSSDHDHPWTIHPGQRPTYRLDDQSFNQSFRQSCGQPLAAPAGQASDPTPSRYLNLKPMKLTGHELQLAHSTAQHRAPQQPAPRTVNCPDSPLKKQPTAQLWVHCRSLASYHPANPRPSAEPGSPELCYQPLATSGPDAFPHELTSDIARRLLTRRGRA